ncbi:MAG: hypothetical protein IPI67_09330 [Myxococcales bacterium]|nr:hypothetical protein [Myxococcales bacterium]
MNKTVSCVAITLVIAVSVACGEDEKLGSGSGGLGGTSESGGAGGTGGSAAAGTGGGAGKGGATGGSAGAGGAAGTGGVAGDAGTPKGRLLVAGTDFFSQTEIATLDLETNTVVGTVTLNDGDAVPAQSRAQAFAIERGNAKLHHLNAQGQIAHTVDVGKTALGLTGTGSTNPVGVVVSQSNAEAGAGLPGVVFFQDVNRLAVVNIDAGSVDKTVDLSAYQVTGDADGSTDVTSPVLHAATGRAFFLLGRIDRTTVAAPNYQLACPSAKALLMAIDLTNNTLVDLNGSAAGEGIELSLVNPVDAALAGNRILVLSAGCYAAGDGGATRTGHGIQAIDLSSGAVSTEYAAPNQDFLSRILVQSGSSALVNTFDPGFAEHWYSWSGGQNLSMELSGVPGAPSLEDPTHLLGVDITTGDAGSSVEVVRYDTSSAQKTLVAASPWTGSFASAAGTALVR